MTIFKFLRYTSRSFQFSKHCFHFSDALASLALIIVTHSLTDIPKLEIGHFSCLTALSPSVLYSTHVNIMSGQSGHSDQTRPESDQTTVRPQSDQTRPNQTRVRPDQTTVRPESDQSRTRPDQTKVGPDQSWTRPDQSRTRPKSDQTRPDRIE